LSPLVYGLEVNSPGPGLILWPDYEWFHSEIRVMKDRTCWSNFTSTICHWNQNNEEKKKLFVLFLFLKIKWRLNICNFFLIRLFNQLRIGTKSAFEFHNNRSVQISVILSNLKIKKIIWNYFMNTYISNFHQYIFTLWGAV
jgi:hypothetical protein